MNVIGEMFYAAAELAAGARLPIAPSADERAAYVVEGTVSVGGTAYPAGELLLFRKGDEIVVEAAAPARVVLIGGPPLDGPRHIWWNFVSSSRDRIEAAKADWRAGRIGRIPGETEAVPLPER